MDYRSLVERKLTPQSNSGKEIVYGCPDCEGSNGHHLYVNYDKNVFNCVRCGFSGRSISKLVRRLGIDISYDYESLYSEQDKELDSIISQKKIIYKSKPLEYSTDIESLTEYYMLHSKMLTFEAYEYLIARGVSPETILKYSIREGVDRFGEVFKIKGKEYLGRNYSGRILVPSLRKDGKISYFVARDYTGNNPVRYLNPPKELGASSEDIFNLDILDTDFVIICEGVFTALAVNQSIGKSVAVATYGKSVASQSSDITVSVTSQGDKLLARKLDEYIIFYDKDALIQAYHTAEYLQDRGATVRVVKIPDDMYGKKADAADMTPEEVRRLIYESKPFDRLDPTFN